MAQKKAYFLVALAVATLIFLGCARSAHAAAFKPECYLGASGNVICPLTGAQTFPLDPRALMYIPGSFNPARPPLFSFFPFSTGPAGPSPIPIPPGPGIGGCLGVAPYEIFSQAEEARNGYRTRVYRTEMGDLMVGIGHIVTPLDGLTEGQTILPPLIKLLWETDSKPAYAAAETQARLAGICDGCFVAALASVNMRMGADWIIKYPRTWALIMAGDYDGASASLNGTLWAAREPQRVRDFQMALEMLPPKPVLNCFLPPVIPPPFNVCDFLPQLCEPPFYNPCASDPVGEPPGNVCSTLGWLSGAYTPTPQLEALRPNNPAKGNICTVFSKVSNDWAGMLDASGGTVDAWVKECANLSIAVRIFPMSFSSDNCPANYARAASGEFDEYYRKMAADLKAAGVPANAVFRIGWELNSDYPWGLTGCRTSADAATYIKGYQHIVDIFRESFGPDFTLAWNFLKNSAKMPLPIESYYPGDAYVDYIDIDYYDNPGTASVAEFNAFANRGTPANPVGINQWLAYAKSKGKMVAFSEWGIVPPERGGRGDNPAYMEAMFNWFKANACSVAFESYFNGGTRGHALGTAEHPRSTAVYKALWGASTSHPKAADEVCSCTPAP